MIELHGYLEGRDALAGQAHNDIDMVRQVAAIGAHCRPCRRADLLVAQSRGKVLDGA